MNIELPATLTVEYRDNTNFVDRDEEPSAEAVVYFGEVEVARLPCYVSHSSHLQQDFAQHAVAAVLRRLFALLPAQE